MNDVRVLTGDEKHFMGFLVAPEDILDQNSCLEVPGYMAAKFEVQLKTLPADAETGQLLSGLPKVPIEKTFLVINRIDAEAIQKILAGSAHRPKGILTYSPAELRVKSWTEPVGDYKIAGKLLKRLFEESGLRPTLGWESNLFVKKPQITDDTFVSDEDAAKANHIVKSGKNLIIMPPQPQGK